jgi:hypothetical protein
MFEGNRDDDKAGIEERYSSAVNSGNLRPNPRTRMSDSDVLGATGIADRELTEGRTSPKRRGGVLVPGDPVRPAPLAVSLERLLRGGDTRAAHAVVRVMADMLWRKAREGTEKLSHAKAKEMAQMVLAWHRSGTCKPCGGHGYSLIQGTKTLSERACEACRGSGKIRFERAFKGYPVELARWMSAELERNLGRAGERAMAHLAARFDLD